MKHSLFLLGLLLSCLCVRPAQAQVVHYDSLAIDSVVSAGVDNPDFVKGNPGDGLVSHFNPTGFLGTQFFVNGTPVDFQKGTALHFYWRKSLVDSSVGDIQFFRLDDLGHFAITGPILRLNEAGPINVEEVASIRVPDTDINGKQITALYNNIVIGVAADPDVSATSFWLDAVELMQSGTMGVSESANAQLVLLENYPNPFLTSNGTTVRLNAPKVGNAEVILTDLLGRGVTIIPVGELSAGASELKIAPPHPGTYIARLRMDGEFVGAPLKITAE